MNEENLNGETSQNSGVDRSEEEPHTEPAYLAGMTISQARDYVVQHIASAQQTRQQLEETQKSLTLWQGRVKLAQEKDMPDLALQAETRVKEFHEKSNAIQLDLWELEEQIPELKQELTRLAAFTPSVDAQQLLEQMEQLVGKETIEENRIDSQLEVKTLDDELALLKAKLKKDGNN